MSSASPNPEAGRSARSRWVLTIRQRLTLWATAITMGVCLLFCMILYAGISWSLQHEVDAFLEGEVGEFLAVLKEHNMDYRAVQDSIRLELSNRSRLELSFRLLDPEGHVLITSDTAQQPTGFWMPVPKRTLADGAMHCHTVRVPGVAAPVRLCSQQATMTDGRTYVAQAGYRLDQTMASLATFRHICLLALAVAGLAALLGGLFMADRSLRPVQMMIAKARQISEAHLDDRLPTRGTGDDLDRLAHTLNDMLDRVQKYVRRMQQFAADASHELRSPLAALRGNAEVMLTRQRSAEELRQAIEDSVEHYTRLSRIAEDLLLLARLDAGEEVLRHEAVPLREAVTDIVDLYGPLATEAGIDLALVEGPEVQVFGDGGRLRQLLGNLVDNAIKYTNAGGSIKVSLQNGAGEAKIVVHDSGIGISPLEQARVFDRFYRVDRARSRRKTSGAGLGLSICRSIVEAHGGHIDLDSQPGAGTKVTVRLPVGEKRPS